jgi:hypothetical protein
LTGALNEPIEVIVTVSVDEPPAPTLRVGELSEIAKSAAEVIVSTKEVVWVPEEPVPLTVMALVPAEALEPTLTVRVADALPPDGMEIGLGLVENATPEGTEPVTDSVTVPAKPC